MASMQPRAPIMAPTALPLLLSALPISSVLQAVRSVWARVCWAAVPVVQLGTEVPPLPAVVIVPATA